MGWSTSVMQKAKAPITDSGSSSTEGLFGVSSGDRNEGGRSLFFISNTIFCVGLRSARFNLGCPGGLAMGENPISCSFELFAFGGCRCGTWLVAETCITGCSPLQAQSFTAAKNAH